MSARRHAQWGGPPPRSAVRDAMGMALLILAFCGSLVLAAWVDLGWVR